MGNKIIKSVSFNLTVLDDAAMLKHVKRRNFSGYVKKLIMADINKNQVGEVTEKVDLNHIEETLEMVKPEPNRLDRARHVQQSMSKPAAPLINQPKR